MLADAPRGYCLCVCVCVCVWRACLVRYDGFALTEQHDFLAAVPPQDRLLEAGYLSGNDVAQITIASLRHREMEPPCAMHDGCSRRAPAGSGGCGSSAEDYRRRGRRARKRDGDGTTDPRNDRSIGRNDRSIDRSIDRGSRVPKRHHARASSRS